MLFLTTQVGGRPVKLDISREETFCNTRTRHSIEFDLAAGVGKDGRLLAKDMHSYSNQGAYASHGHAIAANGLTSWRLQYACPNIPGEKLIQSIPIRRLVEPCEGMESRRYVLLLKVLWMMWQMRFIWIRWNFGAKNLIQGYYEDAYLKPIAANTNGNF